MRAHMASTSTVCTQMRAVGVGSSAPAPQASSLQLALTAQHQALALGAGLVIEGFNRNGPSPGAEAAVRSRRIAAAPTTRLVAVDAGCRIKQNLVLHIPGESGRACVFTRWLPGVECTNPQRSPDAAPQERAACGPAQSCARSGGLLPQLVCLQAFQGGLLCVLPCTAPAADTNLEVVHIGHQVPRALGAHEGHKQRVRPLSHQEAAGMGRAGGRAGGVWVNMLGLGARRTRGRALAALAQLKQRTGPARTAALFYLLKLCETARHTMCGLPGT